MLGNSGNSQSDQQSPRVYWTFWIGIVTAVVAYVVVGLVVGSLLEGEGPESLRILPWIFGAVSVCLLALVFILRGTLARKVPYNNYLVIRWAMADAVAILGLVLVFLGFPWTITGDFFAAALIVLLFLTPTAKLEKEYRSLRGEGLIIS